MFCQFRKKHYICTRNSEGRASHTELGNADWDMV